MALSTKSNDKEMQIKVTRSFAYRKNADEPIGVAKVGEVLTVKKPFGMEMIAADKATDKFKGDVEVKGK